MVQKKSWFAMRDWSPIFSNLGRIGISMAQNSINKESFASLQESFDSLHEAKSTPMRQGADLFCVIDIGQTVDVLTSDCSETKKPTPLRHSSQNLVSLSSLCATPILDCERCSHEKFSLVRS